MGQRGREYGIQMTRAFGQIAAHLSVTLEITHSFLYKSLLFIKMSTALNEKKAQSL